MLIYHIDRFSPMHIKYVLMENTVLLLCTVFRCPSCFSISSLLTLVFPVVLHGAGIFMLGYLTCIVTSFNCDLGKAKPSA